MFLAWQGGSSVSFFIAQTYIFALLVHLQCLGNEFSTLESFVTLSPMPHFRHWLEDKIKQNEDNGTFYDESLLSSEEVRQLQDYSGGNDSDPWESLARVLEDYGSSLANKSSSSDDKVSVEIIRPILMKLASRYLILEKHRGKPLDGVTRFHVGNGAEVHRVNFAADLSKKGVTDSFGMMVNYLYSPERVETNQKEFQLDYRIPASSDVLELLPIATGDSKSRISKL